MLENPIKDLVLTQIEKDAMLPCQDSRKDAAAEPAHALQKEKPEITAGEMLCCGTQALNAHSLRTSKDPAHSKISG